MTKKISQLTAADALTGPEKIEVVQAGLSRRTTAEEIAGMANAHADSVATDAYEGARQRVNHQGFQLLATISDAGSAASHPAGDFDLAGAATAAQAFAIQRGNHTGTQVAATISNFSAAVDARITAWVGAAPGTLDTLAEIDAAINNDPNFATTLTTAIAGKQPLDADLTAIAALASAADKVAFSTGPQAWALTDLTAAGRAVIGGANAAAQRTSLGLGSAALNSAGDFDAAGAAAAAQAFAIQRGNHTGTQLAATISNFTAAVQAVAPGGVLAGTIGAATLVAGSVTNAAHSNMATATFKGNITGGAAPPADLTVAQMAGALAGSTGTTLALGNKDLPLAGGTMTGAILSSRALAADLAYRTQVVGDAGAADRFSISADGTHAWSDGASAFADINMSRVGANALNIDASAGVTFSGFIQTPNGSAASPAVQVGLPNMGFHKISASALGVDTVGAEVARFSGAGLEVRSTGAPGTVEKFRVGTPATVDNAATSILTAGAAADKALVLQMAASASGLPFSIQNSAGTVVYSIATTGSPTLADGANWAFGTTTGTKIGTATTQKLAFWNKTPIVQPTNAIAAAAFVANTSGIVNDTATFGGYTIGKIAAALIAVGILT